MSPEMLAIMQRSVDAIEMRLQTEITVEELAREAGFSRRQFEHVFRAATGMSVGRFVTRRRLLHALWAMSGGMRAVDAALAWGFDTHAGFYKAFRKEFGCAPSQYLRTRRAASPAPVHLQEEIVMDRNGLARVLKAWGLTEMPAPVYHANTGRCSEHTFTVSAGYLKVSRCPGEMRRQAELNHALAAQGLAARVIPTLAGEDVHTEDGAEFLLLAPASGQPVRAEAMLTCRDTARAVGVGLARLHAALRTCDPLLCVEEDCAATLREWAIPTARPVLKDAAWLTDYQARVTQLFPQLETQIIHRDPNPDNILMEGGRVTGFCDFELTRVMPRIFDLCYASTGMLSVAWQEEELRGQYFSATHALWQGYDSVAPLTDAEKSAMPDMAMAIQLICVAAFAGSEKLADVFRVNREMLAYLRENADKLAWRA